MKGKILAATGLAVGAIAVLPASGQATTTNLNLAPLANIGLTTGADATAPQCNVTNIPINLAPLLNLRVDLCF